MDIEDENDFVFSKELREAMSPFKEYTPKECLSSPEFFDALLNFAGLSEEKKKDLWDNVGRPDFHKNKD